MTVKRVNQHFKKADPAIFAILKTMELKALRPVKKDPLIYFQKLCEDIVSQQLAGKAAEAIFNRVVDLVGGPNFTPKQVLKLQDQALRDAGLSWGKVSYVKDLADQVSRGSVRLDHLADVADDQVVAELTKVKGIGPWTAEMFLIFSLGREDVFSHGDLGLRNGLVKLYGLRKPPTIERTNKIVNRWSPYKSYGSLALWHSLDNR